MSTMTSCNCWKDSPLCSWTILFFAALNVIFLGGKRRAFGGFVAELRKDFSSISLTELNWIGNSYAAVAYITSSVSTTLILYFNRRYGISQLLGSLFILFSSLTSALVPNPHWLFLTNTVFHGIGSSLIISTIGLVVNEHFDKQHPHHILATTLISGGSLAAVAFVYFFAFLIQRYDWRIAFLVLGVIYFVINSSAALVFRAKDELIDDSRKTFITELQRIKSGQVPLLILWFIERVMTSVVTYGLLLNLTDYVYRMQHNLVRSTIYTTLFVAGEGSTYLIAAIITAATRDFFKEKLGLILLSTSMLTGIALIAMEFTSHLVTVSRVLCCLSGLALGFSNTLLYPAGEELTRLPGHIAYPFTLAGMGCGMLISPLLTAKIAEAFAYKWFFLVQGCLIFVKVFCLLSILILLFLYKRYDLNPEYQDLATKDYENAMEKKVTLADETTTLIPDILQK